MRRSAPPAALIDLLLLSVALVWGTSYGVAKQAITLYPVLGLLVLRFGLTFVLLLPSLGALRHAAPRIWRDLLLLGGLLLSIFLCEMFGVARTTASNAAFLISLCVVLTPLVEWGLLRRAPSAAEGVAILLSLLGAYLLSGGVRNLSPGDGLILLAALLRGFNVCLTKRVMQHSVLPPLTITAVQSGCVAAGSGAIALLLAPSGLPALPSLLGHPGFWASIAYLIGACTLFAFFVQTYAVRRSSPTRVALLMGSEPVFGALFAMFWLGEHLSLAAWIGGALIVTAAMTTTIPWRKITPRRDGAAASAPPA